MTWRTYVVWWSHALKESWLLWAEIHLCLFPSFTPQHNQFCPIPSPWTRNKGGTSVRVSCKPSVQLCSSGVLTCTSGSIIQTQMNFSSGSRSAVEQCSVQRHGYWRVTDKRNTVAMGRKKKEAISWSFPFLGPRAQTCPVPPTRLLGPQLHLSQQSISECWWGSMSWARSSPCHLDASHRTSW